MPKLSDKLITAARSWTGTRFQHQGRLKGLGVDCVGFISEVVREAGIDIEIPGDYRPQEDGVIMMKILSSHLDFIEPDAEMKQGDVLALCDEALHDEDIPRHLVFVSEVTPTKTTIIHASKQGVVEHRINTQWRSRIHSCWRLKNA